MSRRRRRGGTSFNRLFANWPGVEASEADPTTTNVEDEVDADAAVGPHAEAQAHPATDVVEREPRLRSRVAHRLVHGLSVPSQWMLRRWPGRNYVDEGDEDELEGFEEILEPVRPLEPARPLRPVRPAPRPVDDKPVRRRRRVPLLGLRQLGRVVAAVYAALADPLVGGDQEARERRLARLRSAGLVAGTTVLAVVVIYAMFPVRAYLDQRSATDRAEDRLKVIGEQNERLGEYVDDLQDEDVIEQIAREDYGLIFPGEESYPLLPAPEDEDAGATEAETED